MTLQDDELEQGIDAAVLLRTKIRNTLYNNEIGFSMRNAGSRTAEQMADDLVEQLAGIAESIIKQREEVIKREAQLACVNDILTIKKGEITSNDTIASHAENYLYRLTSQTNQKEER